MNCGQPTLPDSRISNNHESTEIHGCSRPDYFVYSVIGIVPDANERYMLIVRHRCKKKDFHTSSEQRPCPRDRSLQVVSATAFHAAIDSGTLIAEASSMCQLTSVPQMQSRSLSLSLWMKNIDLHKQVISMFFHRITASAEKVWKN